MEESITRPYRLAKELSQLFDLESKIEKALSVSMYQLNKFMNAERSSIFIFQHWDDHLTIFSSLDLGKDKIRIPKSCGVAGWVFVNRKPALVNNAYDDPRFYKDIDATTGFTTRNLICTPLLLSKDQCLGTIQSLNKRNGDFTNDDLELLELAASMIAIAINNKRIYTEMMVTSKAHKKFIKQITQNVGNIFDQ